MAKFLQDGKLSQTRLTSKHAAITFDISRSGRTFTWRLLRGRRVLAVSAKAFVSEQAARTAIAALVQSIQTNHFAIKEEQ